MESPCHFQISYTIERIQSSLSSLLLALKLSVLLGTDIENFVSFFAKDLTQNYIIFPYSVCIACPRLMHPYTVYPFLPYFKYGGDIPVSYTPFYYFFRRASSASTIYISGKSEPQSPFSRQNMYLFKYKPKTYPRRFRIPYLTTFSRFNLTASSLSPTVSIVSLAVLLL